MLKHGPPRHELYRAISIQKPALAYTLSCQNVQACNHMNNTL